MLEIAYLLIFYVSAIYSVVTYFLAFFLNYQLSPLPFGILMAMIFLVYFVAKPGKYRTNGKAFKSTSVKLILGLYTPLLALTFLYKAENALPALSVATPYLIVFLTSMVLLLQLLRHQAGTKDKKNFEKFQRLQALGFFAFTILGTVGRLFELIMRAINLLIIRPVGYLIFAAMSSLSQTVENGNAEGLGTNNNFNNVVEQEKIEAGFDGANWKEVVNSILSREEEKVTEPTMFFKILSAVVIAILAIVIIIVFIVIIRNLSKDRKKNFVIHEEREDSVENYETATRLKKHFAPPDIQIRYYYKEFMKKSDSEKHRLKDSDTTKDIMGKYLRKQSMEHNVPNPSSQEVETSTALTDLYRKTRYSTKEVTKDDAALMKKLIKSC